MTVEHFTNRKNAPFLFPHDSGHLLRELADALTLTRRIGYPTLTWQAAHLLALAQTATGEMLAARLVIDTLDQIVSRLPDAALQRTFLAWNRVNTAPEDMERLLR